MLLRHELSYDATPAVDPITLSATGSGTSELVEQTVGAAWLAGAK